jgi:hypothetical protein
MGSQRPLSDRKLGDRRVAIEPSHPAYFRSTGWSAKIPAPITIVVLPEYVARHWWDRVLYNQSAKRLKAALVGREHTVIADVPYRRGQ